MLFIWSILLAFKVGNVSLIFKMSDVVADVLEAWAYDLPFWVLEGPMLLLIEDFLERKYLEMVLISFLDLARRGGRGGALLTEMGFDLGVSFLELLLGEGVRGENFEAILDLRMFVFWSVNKASYLDT